MTALITLLTVVTLSLLVTRIATVALVSTGLSREAARFQARSAFSGSGFTTREAETVVGHPVRRRIIMLLMLLGNAGIVTVISTLILSFVDTQGPREWGLKITILVGGLALLLFLARSQLVERVLNRIILWALRRWTDLDVSDYAGLLHLAGDYRVVELHVDPGEWLEGRTLAELRLSEEGILVLGVETPAGYEGTPRGGTLLEAGFTLILYGRTAAIEDLDRRPAGIRGDAAHHRAVAEQARVEEREEEALEAAAEAARRAEEAARLAEEASGGPVPDDGGEDGAEEGEHPAAGGAER